MLGGKKVVIYILGCKKKIDQFQNNDRLIRI